MHQHTGLAATRARNDEQVANGSGHGLALAVIQAVQNGCDVLQWVPV